MATIPSSAPAPPAPFFIPAAAPITSWEQMEFSDTTPAPCQKHAACPTGEPVQFCLIPGLGHVVWDQGAVAEWDFFKAL